MLLARCFSWRSRSSPVPFQIQLQCMCGSSQKTDEEEQKMRHDKTLATSTDLSVLSDLCTPWCIHVVAALRIADHIAAGTTNIKALAEKAECDPDFLQRVLRHLVGKGVFAEPTPGQFALNEAAQGLLDPVFLDLNGIGGRGASDCGNLLPPVRTGAPPHPAIFGLSL